MNNPYPFQQRNNETHHRGQFNLRALFPEQRLSRFPQVSLPAAASVKDMLSRIQLKRMMNWAIRTRPIFTEISRRAEEYPWFVEGHLRRVLPEAKPFG